MASALETRVRRLEAATGVGGFPPCPECGWPHDGGDDNPDDTYEVVFVDEDEEEGEPYSFCEECGERIPTIVFPDQDLSRES